MKSHYKGYHRFYVTLQFRITFTGLEKHLQGCKLHD